VVLVRADVGAVGRVRDLGRLLMGALRDVVGEEGSLMTLAFTRNFVWPRLDRSRAFRADTVPNTGALAKLFLREPGARRSRHPTNSVVALGSQATCLISGHDATAPSFLPISRLVELDGKQLVVGCVDSSPGFTTTHWAQHQLGLSRRSLLVGWVGAYYEEGGSVRRFLRPDIGGCSRGFATLYAEYERAGLLRRGRVGDAASVCVDARPALALELELLRVDPRRVLCDDPYCLLCRGSWLYNKRQMLGFWPRFAVRSALAWLRGRAKALQTPWT
jgi:aminoglycoside N3'-acetyltransferase